MAKDPQAKASIPHVLLLPSQVASFRKTVYRHFHRHGRSLPWRRHTTPYRTLVSEVMLQQTQVERVVPMFRSFLKAFPSFASLARASRREVLAAWQGLGYNRRAVRLHECARVVRQEYGGRLPGHVALLGKLPGIGSATAASIAAFAFGEPTIFVETNIRAVFIHHFFPGGKLIDDAALTPIVKQTLDRKDPARWYNALMDYGAALKKRHADLARRSAHYARQTPFRGSDRQIRGRVLHVLLSKRILPGTAVRERLGVPAPRLKRILDRLGREGFVRRTRRGYTLA